MRKEEEFKILRVPIPTPTLYPHTTTNSYLIGNSQESILVDAGYNVPETRTLLEKTIVENKLAIPKRIILTHAHPDHAPGVRQLTDWSPVVYCHEEENKGIVDAIAPFEKIAFLHDKEWIKVANKEILIIHGPGHTAGHLSLYIPATQLLISGDNIVAEGTTWIGPPDGDMMDYIKTLKRLKNLKLSRIGPGHGDWVNKPYEHIDFVINRRLQREKQIQSLLKEHKQLTATELTEKIYQDTIHPSIFKVATKTTEAHLIKLMKEGIVVLEGTTYSIAP